MATQVRALTKCTTIRKKKSTVAAQVMTRSEHVTTRNRFSAGSQTMAMQVRAGIDKTATRNHLSAGSQTMAVQVRARSEHMMTKNCFTAGFYTTAIQYIFIIVTVSFLRYNSPETAR